jgi:hypothetical protein
MSTRPASDVSVALVASAIANPAYRTPVNVWVVPVLRTQTTTPLGAPVGVCVNVRSPVVVSTLLTPVVPLAVGQRVFASWATATVHQRRFDCTVRNAGAAPPPPSAAGRNAT